MAFEPCAAALYAVRALRGEAHQPERPGMPDEQPGARRAPQLPTQQAERQPRSTLHRLHRLPVRLTVARADPIELRDIRFPVGAQDQAAAIRAQHCRGRACIQEPQALLLERTLQLRIVGRRDEQRIERRQRIVPEAAMRELLGANAAAEQLAALEEADAPVAASEQRGTNE
jgi:hypothetical protein